MCAGELEYPHAGGDRTVDGDWGLPPEESRASDVGHVPSTVGVHPGHVQSARTVAWAATGCSRIHSSFVSRVQFVRYIIEDSSGLPPCIPKMSTGPCFLCPATKPFH